MSTQTDLDPGVIAEAPPPGQGRAAGVLRVLGAAGQQSLLVSWVGVLIGIVLIGAFLTFRAPCRCFLTGDNILTVMQEFSYVAIAALGGAMVIMTRGIDLSVGANMALTGLIAADMMGPGHGMPAVLAVLIGLALGLLVGLVNAFLITVIGLQPFIATLGMLSVIRGTALVRSQGFTLYPPSSFTHLGQGTVAGIPNPVIIMVVLTVILTIFLSNTALGRHIYAVGGNENASRLLGIKVQWVKVFVYAAAGVLAGVGGILLMSFLGSADPGGASGYELDVIAAAVIGGVSLFGGEGSLIGVILGAALIEEIRNGMTLMNVQSYWTPVVIGIVILLAMTVDQARRRLRRAYR